MKKVALQATIIMLTLAGCTWWSQIKPDNIGLVCGGVAGVPCPAGYTCEYDDTEISDSFGTCVSDSATCPTDGPFEVGFDSDERYCECPEGYTKDSNIIGYATCYDNAECPILKVECVQS